jgi:hypothetical protein
VVKRRVCTIVAVWRTWQLSLHPRLSFDPSDCNAYWRNDLPKDYAGVPLALPALNRYGMKEGSEKVFGKGYNILPIFKDRLNAKMLITAPNSDVCFMI